MAHSLSAKKRIRQTLKRNARNRFRKQQIKDQTKAYLAALAKGDAKAAAVELNKVVSRLDKVAAKHTIHKNTAARKRSRLTLRLNAIGKTPVVAPKSAGKSGAKSAAKRTTKPRAKKA